jgi:hypothetical protein
VYITPHAGTSGSSAARNSVGETSTSPGSSDDESDGFGIGSLWVTTTRLVFMCLDATADAAIWVRMLVYDPESQEAAIPQDGLTQGVSITGVNGYPQLRLGVQAVDQAYGATGVIYTGSRVAQPSVVAPDVVWTGETTDATPVNLEWEDADSTAFGLHLTNDGAAGFDCIVTASDLTDLKVWRAGFGFNKVDGTLTLGSVTVDVLSETAGASTWDVDVVEDGGDAKIEVTGQAAKDILWLARLKGVVWQSAT